MKRSEVVDMIYERLIPLNVGKDICNEIIEIIEKAGMLPPRTKLGELGVEDNSWEPEDEQ